MLPKSKGQISHVLITTFCICKIIVVDAGVVRHYNFLQVVSLELEFFWDSSSSFLSIVFDFL